MVSELFPTLVLFIWSIPVTFGGNQCNTQFPGQGYCIDNRAQCPRGSEEFPRLSNGIGCPTMNNRCCVAGGVPGGKTPDRSQCGMGTLPLRSRIFNGINAGPCDWPFVVSIRAKLRTSSRLDYDSTTHICAGVLIDKSWVLTSAVCILNAGRSVQEAPNRFIVVAGEYNVSGIDIDPISGRQQEQLIRVQRAIVHPDYAYSNSDQIDLKNPVLINSHGVGLIKLAQPIIGRCSGLICLPTQDEENDRCANYKSCVITGWGFISESYSPAKGSLDRLKQGRVNLASKKGCDLVVKRFGLQNARYRGGTLCKTPATDILTDGCLSDEGGAVMCSTGTQWVVRGILPSQTCNRNKYNVFVTDVGYYRQWITNTMAVYG